MAKVARALELDLARFGASGIVVVGSNGKGSTAAMTSALLEQTGESVGLFTSPHLFDLNERFRIDGADISDAALEAHWARVLAAVERAGERENLGAFEFLFLIAADAFAVRDCAYTVWEAGIGGRLDPVSLIEARTLALTSLDFEHTELLGDTLEEIAREKLGAAPAGATVFLSESCLPQRAAIEAHCAARGVASVLVGADGSVPRALAGAFQAQNAALARALARDVAALTPAQEQAGLASTRWPGRLEVIEDEPLVVIDVGHTPAAVRAALEGFHSMRGARKGVLVAGVSRDKDIAEIIGALAPAFEIVICAAVLHKGAPASQIAAHVQTANPAADVIIAESVAEAHRIALMRGANGAVYAAGSLFLAAEFKAVHIGRDPASLVFF
ncbi:MAG: bifunctional folylpolyglutamate synthase/dihydrofolate synthase [Phycisphaerales bacterium]|nr:bifunctional folylpolyglutamate synthase/dihydrofolate synthase [Hyphomonadaceae bacterium]